jgi:hypothetical protein
MENQERMSMPRALRHFLKQSAVWAVLCFATEAVCRFVLHWSFPYDYPAMPFILLFGDFRQFFWKLFLFHSPSFFSVGPLMMYPATLAVCLKFLMLFPGSHEHPKFVIIRFLCLVLATSWVMLFVVRKSLVRRGLQPRLATVFVAVMYVCAFPFWFEVHTLNMEFVVWVVIVTGLWGFWTGRPWVASIFFGIAGAMKIFPFVFLGLLLVRKQYRQAIFAPVVAVIVTVASLWLVCPDIPYSYRQFNAAIARFRPSYVLHFYPNESGFDHSMFCLIKRLFPNLPNPVTLGHILTGYMVVVAVGGVILFFTRIRKLPVANQVLCLSIAAILLPPVSYEYTLLHLYAPLVLLAFCAVEHFVKNPAAPSPRGLSLVFGLFAFILSPQSEFIFHGYRFAAQLQSVGLILLWAVAMIYPFQVSPDGTTPVNDRMELEGAAA